MTVIPDSIEPVEGWRFWRFTDQGLASLNEGVLWMPGKPMEAKCRANMSHGSPSKYYWDLAPGGMGLDRCAEYVEERRRESIQGYGPWIPDPPVVAPPPTKGYRLALRDPRHPAPDEGCTCGLYAADSLSLCPGGTVWGKVKGWGKIVPGEHGWRAKYAYPSVLYAPPKIAKHPTLLAYGVEIIEQEAAPDSAPMSSLSVTFLPPRPRMRSRDLLGVSLGLNLGAFALNVAVAAMKGQWF